MTLAILLVLSLLLAVLAVGFVGGLIGGTVANRTIRTEHRFSNPPPSQFRDTRMSSDDAAQLRTQFESTRPHLDPQTSFILPHTDTPPYTIPAQDGWNNWSETKPMMKIPKPEHSDLPRQRPDYTGL